MNKVSEYLPRWLAAALQGLLVLYIIASEDIFENQDGTLYWLGFVVSVLALAVMIWHLVRPDKVEIKLLQLLLSCVGLCCMVIAWEAIRDVKDFFLKGGTLQILICVLLLHILRLNRWLCLVFGGLSIVGGICALLMGDGFFYDPLVSVLFLVAGVGLLVSGCFRWKQRKGRTDPSPVPPKPEPPKPEPPKPEPPKPLPPKPAALFCKECGAKLNPGDIYCVECGNRVE